MKNDDLIECVDCGMLVDPDDEYCPYCDTPIFKPEEKKRNNGGGAGSLIVGIIVVVVVILLLK